MTAGVRSSNLPVAALVEVLGHYDAGGGQKAVGRSSLAALVDALRGIITNDPSGVANLRADLSALQTKAAQLADGKQDAFDLPALRALLAQVQEGLADEVARGSQRNDDLLAATDHLADVLQGETAARSTQAKDLSDGQGRLAESVAGEQTARAALATALKALTEATGAQSEYLQDQIDAEARVGASLSKALNETAGNIQAFVDRTDAEFDKANFDIAAVRSDLAALGQILAQMQAVLAKKADATELTAQRAEYVGLLGSLGRPGDTPAAFTLVDRITATAGPRSNLPEVPKGLLALGDHGAVVRITGSGILATRRAFPLEIGRIGRLRSAVQRRIDPADPAGDAVQTVLIWLDQGYGLLPAADRVTVVKRYDHLQVGVGRQAREVLFSRSPVPGLSAIQAPAQARFVVAAVWTFGPDGVTDVEILDFDDVTSATVLDPVSGDVAAQVSAFTSLDAGARLDLIESRQNAPRSVTFETRAAAAAASATAIPATVTTVTVKGRDAPGDGRGGDYKRIAGTLTAGEDGFVAAGASFRRVQTAQDVFNATTAPLLLAFLQSLPTDAPPEGGLYLAGGIPALAPRSI